MYAFDVLGGSDTVCVGEERAVPWLGVAFEIGLSGGGDRFFLVHVLEYFVGCTSGDVLNLLLAFDLFGGLLISWFLGIFVLWLLTGLISLLRHI